MTKPDVDEKTLKNITLVLFLIAVICAASAATQYTAAKLGYQEALYWSVWDFGSWKLYNPFAVFAWNGDYRKEAPVLFINAYSIFGISTVVATMILVFIRLLFHKKTTDNYGSARFATRSEMEAGHLLDGRGIILGLTDDGYYLRDDEKTHDFLCAPTRSGKGVGIIIPTLLSWPHSVLVVDVKGENYAFTAGRRQKMGQIILKFDPTSLKYIDEKGRYSTEPEAVGVKFNPLDEIRMGTPHEVRDCQNICRVLADPTGKGYEGANAHWTSNASDLLFAMVLHLKWLNKNEPVNITTVLEYMASDSQGLQHLLKEIVERADIDLKHDDTGEVLKFTNASSDRLQAALAVGTIVIEAGIGGGTMHAVNTTLKLERPLAFLKFSEEHYEQYENASANKSFLENGKALPIANSSDIDNFLNACTAKDVASLTNIPDNNSAIIEQSLF